MANVNDVPKGSVTISGTATEGQMLMASNTLGDADGLGPISYQWKRRRCPNSSATGDSYILSQAQVGTNITVVASYTDLRPGGNRKQRGDRRGGQRQRLAEGQRQHQRHGY